MMSFLSGLRGLAGGGRRDIDPGWNLPESESDVDALLSGGDKPQLIYKHSFACGVCVFSKSAIESKMEQFKKMADLHFVDARATRSVSDYIADKTGIKHESPQALIIKNGKVIWHASHSAITAGKIMNALEN